MSLICLCDDWETQIQKLNGPIVLASIRAGRDLFDGKPFKFCPWCGMQLMLETENAARTQDNPTDGHE